MATSARQLSSGHIINDLKKTIPVSLPKKGREQDLVKLTLEQLLKLETDDTTLTAARNVIRARMDRMNHFRKVLEQEPLATAESAADWERQLFADARRDPRVTAHQIKSALADLPYDLRDISLRTLVASRDLTAIEVSFMGREVEDGRVADYMVTRRPLDASLQAIGRSFATTDARQSLRGVERAVSEMMHRPPRFLSFGEQATRSLRVALSGIDTRLKALADDPMGLDVDLDFRQREVETMAYRRASKEAVALISESVDEMREIVGESSRLSMNEFAEVQRRLANLQNELRAREQTVGIEIDDAHQTVIRSAPVDAMITRLHDYSKAVTMRFDAAKFYLDRHPTEVKTKVDTKSQSARSVSASERGSDVRDAIFAADLMISVRDAEFQDGVWDLRGRLANEPGASYVPMFRS